MSTAKTYQVGWYDRPKDIEGVNTKLATQLNRIDEMLTTLFAAPVLVEGEWTPADASGGGLTFTDSAGRYFQLGTLVILTGYVKYPTTASTATAAIGGLPSAVDATTSQVRYAGTVKSDETTVARLAITSSSFIAPTTTADAAITNATLSTNYLYFTITYRTPS